MNVNRIEQQIIKRSNPIWEIVDKYSYRAKNVYNYANYIIRQEFINNDKWIRAYDLQKMCKDADCYKELGSQAAQKTIQVLDQNWKSFFKSIKDWKKHPDKYLGMPKLPKYLPKDGRTTFYLKNIQCSLKDGIFRISFKPFGGYSVNTHADGKLMQCRFVPRGNNYILEIVYEVDVPDIDSNVKSERIASVDLGVNNLMTITTNCNIDPFVINGKPLKSINQFYNKEFARIQSGLKTKHNADWSKALQKLTTKRNNKVNDYIHKSTTMVVNFCKDNNIDTLVCGLNKGWKQESDIGKKNNQNFVSIPHHSVIQKLEYKCENYGIKFFLTEEGYTSGTSFLDGEEPIKQNYDKSRRKPRGLFRANNGGVINSDVNGSYQIMKKVFPDVFSDGIEGVGLHPVRLNIV